MEVANYLLKFVFATCHTIQKSLLCFTILYFRFRKVDFYGLYTVYTPLFKSSNKHKLWNQRYSSNVNNQRY